jgi:hypothetical protein
MDGGLERARSLRDVFASMSQGSADPATTLARAGHPDLPGPLVTEAIISYSDAAPVEVAEHLQPYVVANSAVPAADGHPYPATDLPAAFSLLASAPAPVDAEGHDPYDVHPGDQHSLLDDGLHDGLHDPIRDAGQDDAGQDDAGQDDAGQDDAGQDDAGQDDLWFGHGQVAALGTDPLDPDPLDRVDAGQRAEPGHPDPWLAGPDHVVPEQIPDHHGALWNAQIETGHHTGYDLIDQSGDPALPAQDPAPHDLPDPSS